MEFLHALCAVLYAHAFTIWWRSGFAETAQLMERRSIHHALLAGRAQAA